MIFAKVKRTTIFKTFLCALILIVPLVGQVLIVPLEVMDARAEMQLERRNKFAMILVVLILHILIVLSL